MRTLDVVFKLIESSGECCRIVLLSDAKKENFFENWQF